jgi:uncharacterized protein YjiS (DUF1127 family)
MKTQKQTNLLAERALEAGETLYEIAQTSAAVPADLHPRDRAPTVASLGILHHLRIAYRSSRERYRQRRQLMEMDDRELEDIGITREQAEHEARKPIWEG